MPNGWRWGWNCDRHETLERRLHFLRISSSIVLSSEILIRNWLVSNCSQDKDNDKNIIVPLNSQVEQVWDGNKSTVDMNIMNLIRNSFSSLSRGSECKKLKAKKWYLHSRMTFYRFSPLEICIVHLRLLLPLWYSCMWASSYQKHSPRTHKSRERERENFYFLKN